ncbi:hypothetical protein [Pseudoalteromonas xiamenensis]
MKKLIGLIALLGFASISKAGDSYVVNTKIYENKNLIGSPTLVINPNQEATVSVDNLYSFALKLTTANDSTVSLNTKLEVGGENISPSLVVELGKEASINIGGKEFSVVVNKSSS